LCHFSVPADTWIRCEASTHALSRAIEHCCNCLLGCRNTTKIIRNSSLFEMTYPKSACWKMWKVNVIRTAITQTILENYRNFAARHGKNGLLSRNVRRKYFLHSTSKLIFRFSQRVCTRACSISVYALWKLRSIPVSRSCGIE